jgi:hypothetical protein
MPAHAVTAAQLTENWIAAAQRQLASTPLETRARALKLALGYGMPSRPSDATRAASRRRTVIAAGVDQATERQLRSAGFTVKKIDFTPFDAAEAEKIPHFDSYNRTAASQRVADIVEALRGDPGAALVASADEALAAVFAAAIEPGRKVVLDVGDFDTSSDGAFVDRLYIPGLRKAGDFATALGVAGDHVVIHNAGARFMPEAPGIRREKLEPRDLVKLLR